MNLALLIYGGIGVVMAIMIQLGISVIVRRNAPESDQQRDVITTFTDASWFEHVTVAIITVVAWPIFVYKYIVSPGESNE